MARGCFLPPFYGGGGPPKAVEGAAANSECVFAPSTTLRVVPLPRFAEEDLWRTLDSMRYAVVIEKAEGNYSAYVPDLPGCVATGESVKATEENIRAAIRFHIDGLREDHLPIPEPSAIAEYVDV